VLRRTVLAAALLLTACSGEQQSQSRSEAAGTSVTTTTTATGSSSTSEPAAKSAPAEPTQEAPLTTATQRPAGAPPSCATAPQSLVGETLGVSVTAPKESTAEFVVVCEYGSGTKVRFQSSVDSDRFAQGKSRLAENGQTASDLAGLGDEAYTSSLRTANTVVARKGTVEILVTSTASHDAAKKLITSLFAKL
jgi:hypothetical protein